MNLSVQSNSYNPSFNARVVQARNLKSFGKSSQKVFQEISEALKDCGDDSIKVTLSRGKSGCENLMFGKVKKGLFQKDRKVLDYRFVREKDTDKFANRMYNSFIDDLKTIVEDFAK